jgi:phosphoribosyl-AMP cyclohydrolase / phosphoribosyl-ATP pyrophosphohydrolase
MLNVSDINFKKMNGLVPCIVQDAKTKTVLMLGFMNEEAVTKTVQEKRVTFFSRSKQRLWTKGETSGNFLGLVDMKLDCDQDSILVYVNPKGATCHTGTDTCFRETNSIEGITFLENIIADRKKNPKSGSYTNSLFNSGINKMAQKLGEEAVELVIEAKDDNKDLFLGESADLMYHFLVLLVAKGYTMNEVTAVLKQRHAS